MALPIQLISTDFDGTLHADHEVPPVPVRLQELIGDLQGRGAKWVINTGRDLSSLMEGLGRAHLSIQPDWLVTVEREIYFREGPRFFPLQPWNGDCDHAHRELFKAVEKDIKVAWLKQHPTRGDMMGELVREYFLNLTY